MGRFCELVNLFVRSDQLGQARDRGSHVRDPSGHTNAQPPDGLPFWDRGVDTSTDSAEACALQPNDDNGN